MKALKNAGGLTLENLEKVLKSGRIPHSFLIEGSTKEKRMKTALSIAKSVVCTGENKPCGVCLQCKTADSGSNPDISFIVPAKDKKFVSVDQIRQLRLDAFVMPHSAERRVFIIEDALLLNEQGQNALLKILEEPPETVVFILLCESRMNLLPTVISRCSLFILNENEEKEDAFSSSAGEFISLLFDNREYEMLILVRKYEKDRTKAQKFLVALKEECLKRIKNGDTSNYKCAVLSKIFDTADSCIESVAANVNLTLMFSAMVCKCKSFMK